MECHNEECCSNTESLIRRLKGVEDDRKIYMKTIKRLCGGELKKYLSEIDLTLDEMETTD